MWLIASSKKGTDIYITGAPIQLSVRNTNRRAKQGQTCLAIAGNALNADERTRLSGGGEIDWGLHPLPAPAPLQAQKGRESHQ